MDTNSFYKVLLENVLYIKADDDYTFVYTEQGRFMNTSRLGDLEIILSHLPFRRVHRSYIVHLSKITRIDASNYKLFIGSVELPFSRKLRRELVELDSSV